MPQIAQIAETWSSQLFWLLVFFGFVYFVVGRGMVPKIMGTVDARDGQIASDLAAAQAARDKADEEEEAWRQRENANRARAQELVAKAKAEASAETERRLADAQMGIDETLDEAADRISASRVDALGKIESVAAEATQDIVRKLAGIEVEAARAEAAVKEVMAHG